MGQTRKIQLTLKIPTGKVIGMLLVTVVAIVVTESLPITFLVNIFLVGIITEFDPPRLS